MTFDDLPAGVSIFLDANSLVYPFAPEPVLGPPCAQLLRRIENQERLAFTATHVLSEVAHRLMAIVAVMQSHGLVNLASNDADFDRVPGLTRYAPA